MEQERSGVWFVAPLISKLHSSVQGRVLRAAGKSCFVLSCSVWFVAPLKKEHDE